MNLKDSFCKFKNVQSAICKNKSRLVEKLSLIVQFLKSHELDVFFNCCRIKMSENTGDTDYLESVIKIEPEEFETIEQKPAAGDVSETK